MNITVIVFTIPQGIHYQRFDTLVEAVEAIKDNVEHLLYLLPSITIGDDLTGNEFITKIEDAMTLGHGIDREGFIQTIGGEHALH